jgi:protein-disulfide isomerase
MVYQEVFKLAVVVAPMAVMAAPTATLAAVTKAAKAASYVAYTPAAEPDGIVIVGGTPYAPVTTLTIWEYTVFSVVSVPAVICADMVDVTELSCVL